MMPSQKSTNELSTSARVVSTGSPSHVAAPFRPARTARKTLMNPTASGIPIRNPMVITVNRFCDHLKVNARRQNSP